MQYSLHTTTAQHSIARNHQPPPHLSNTPPLHCGFTLPSTADDTVPYSIDSSLKKSTVFTASLRKGEGRAAQWGLRTEGGSSGEEGEGVCVV